jgi:hypothetical protein
MGVLKHLLLTKIQLEKLICVADLAQKYSAVVECTCAIHPLQLRWWQPLLFCYIVQDCESQPTQMGRCFMDFRVTLDCWLDTLYL